MRMFSDWTLAFDDGVSREQIVNQLIANRSVIQDHVLRCDPISDEDINRACDFLSLTESRRALLDPSLGVPMLPLLPIDGSVVIDYAWQLRLLEVVLLFGVKVEDQNFKGDALESLINEDLPSVLPTHESCALDGTSRQVDGSFEKGDILIIAECKAIARSLGYVRGDATAQRYRMDKLSEALEQVDDKAQWLAARPFGRNYQVGSHIRWICPLVVTPFTEFMPSLDQKLWLHTLKAARVMKPSELAEALKTDEIFTHQCLNMVPVAP
jgi:hypothetical protein